MGKALDSPPCGKTTGLLGWMESWKTVRNAWSISVDEQADGRQLDRDENLSLVEQRPKTDGELSRQECGLSHWAT